ncbi:MAG: HRDC domain-containing protein [Deltaproteobacteria bacterium]|nr:HRDC domain-containing protein [Deltaproteobacteria bacterium]
MEDGTAQGGATAIDGIRWVRTPDDVAALAERLRGVRAFGIDTESDSLWHFREKVCLVQIAAPDGEVFLIDTLAVRDLAPLAPVVADPRDEKVIHGADYDVAVLRRDFGFAFRGLLDTMLAARFLGYPSVGLAAVARHELGVVLSKGPRTSDWSRRPIDPVLVRYGAEDARHLIPLRDRLVGKLAAAGREAWVREECDEVAAMPAAASKPAPADWQRAPGIRDLDPTARSVLRELFAVREQVADRLDRPRFKVAMDEVLVAIARRMPADAADLAPIRGLPGPVARRPAEWLDAVRRGIAAGPLDAPRPEHVRRRCTPCVSRRIGRIREWRDGAAARLGLEPGLVLPQRLVVQVAVANPTDAESLSAVPGIRRWRVEALGAELLRAIRT